MAKQEITTILTNWFHIYWDRSKPMLLAYSGGVDSKALLYALKECGFASFIHLAHVDHGWREGSEQEAKALGQEAKNLGIPFHSTRLFNITSEEQARNARLEFFRNLQDKVGFQAVLLAHHADDLAETVAKRLFEGASLPFLYGMKPISCIDGVSLWRPLLSISRAEIEAWLERRGLVPLFDSTNFDKKYLRTRFRSEIFPFLESSFGKKVKKNFEILSQRSEELHEFLDHRVQAVWDEALKGPFGWAFEGRHWDNLARIERRFLLQKLAKQEGVSLTRSRLESFLDLLEKREQNSLARVGNRKFLIDRGKFFLFASQLPQWGPPLFLERGVFQWGDWQVEVSSKNEGSSDWRSFWQGHGRMGFQEESTLIAPQIDFAPLRKALEWGKMCNPLHPWAPALIREGRVVEVSCSDCSRTSQGQVNFLYSPQ